MLLLSNTDTTSGSRSRVSQQPTQVSFFPDLMVSVYGDGALYYFHKNENVMIDAAKSSASFSFIFSEMKVSRVGFHS